MAINYTYNVVGITTKMGGNGEILQVHVDLVGTDSSSGVKASRQFATSLNERAHTDDHFVVNPNDTQKLTWAKDQWASEMVKGTGVPTLDKFEESIKNEIETGSP
tara:strand:+ start:1456 stop:1770 length:315 start_codon:yes stop_codon:yes gene_type:complete